MSVELWSLLAGHRDQAVTAAHIESTRCTLARSPYMQSIECHLSLRLSCTRLQTALTKASSFRIGIGRVRAWYTLAKAISNVRTFPFRPFTGATRKILSDHPNLYFKIVRCGHTLKKDQP